MFQILIFEAFELFSCLLLILDIFAFLIPDLWSNLCDYWDGCYLVHHSHLYGESLGDLLHHQGQAAQGHHGQDEDHHDRDVDLCLGYFFTSTYGLE